MKRILCATGPATPGVDSPAIVLVRHLPATLPGAPSAGAPGLRDLSELLRNRAATWKRHRTKSKT